MITGLHFTLLSDIQRFETWLERFRLAALPHQLPFSADKTLWIFHLPTFQSETLGLRKHLIEAAVIRPVPAQPDKIELFLRFPVIEISLFELSQRHLNFQLDCFHHLLLRFCLDLLARLEGDWPDASHQLHRPLTRLLNAEDDPYGRKSDNFLDEVRETPPNGLLLYPDQWASLNTPLPPPPAQPASTGVDGVNQGSAIQKWAALTPATRLKFRQAWIIYQQMSREYQKNALDGVSIKAKPTIHDFRARILHKMGWKVGERRLWQVIAMGEAGEIK
jgi:hypothetical protein